MTRINDLGWIGFPFLVGDNEDWRDSSYQYLDEAGVPIPFDGIALEFMMRATATSPIVVLSASTSGQIGGVPTKGMLVTTPCAWGIIVPRAVMLKVPAGSYVWEVQGFAEIVRTIGGGTVTVTEGVVR